MATADEYAAWIVANKAKQGTPEFDIVAKAYQEAKVDQPVVVKAGNSLREIPRQVGLTLRHGAEGAAELADIVAAPAAGVYNTVANLVSHPKLSDQITGEKGFRFKENPTKTATTGLLDAIGVPKPENATERVVGDMSRMVSSAGGLSSVARKGANVVSETGRRIAAALADNPALQATSAAGSGGAGGSVRESGGGEGEQFGASLVGGLSAAGMSALGAKAYNGIASALGEALRPKQTMQQINVTLNQLLEQNGIDVAQIPAIARSELAFEVKKALDTGKQLNPDVVRRIADYGVVGATPTRGTVTLDPVQITQEKNLAKLGANSGDPRLQELSRVQNSNNAKFIENLNTLGGSTQNASNPIAAGERAIGAVSARDASAKGTENALYNRAKDSSGRQIDLDREGFVFDAYNRLGKENKSAFLPGEIKDVLEQLRVGKMKLLDGTETAAPFNVDVIDNLKTMLATASRGAKDGNTRAAIAQVRNALEDVQPKAVGRPVGGNQIVDPTGLSAAQAQADEVSGASMDAFDKARKFARARRSWQESAPGIAAALDDANPDRFVKDYILSGSNKASTADVERLMFTVRRDPEAMQAVKENVVGHLKQAALGRGVKDEVGNFSQSGYNSALDAIGDAKLRLFFNKDEIAQLKALGRVSSYEMVQPKGSAVNNSNTAGTFAGLLDRIANSSLVGKLPFGEAAIRTPAKNWSLQIGTNNALDADRAIGKKLTAPEVARLENLFGPGLLLAAPSANGRNEEKRR